MSHIATICHISVNMSNWGKICPYKMRKNVLDKRRPIHLQSNLIAYFWAFFEVFIDL